MRKILFILSLVCLILVQPSVYAGTYEDGFVNAAERGDLAEMRTLASMININGDTGGKALTRAVDYRKIEAVKFLLSQGVNPNYAHYGTPVLHIALRKCNEASEMEILHLLLQAGANPNYLPGRTDHTALTIAVRQGYDVVKLILDFGGGASINRANDCLGDTPLPAAALNDADVRVLALLLDNGADINYCSQYIGGQTALMRYAAKGNLECVKYLLSRGANKNIRNSSGETAEILAYKYGSREVWDYIRQY